MITTRLDVQGLSGLEVQRECASTRAQMTSNSQNSSLAIAKPVGAAQSVDLGVEVEVHHFLLFDQHTFEGNLMMYVFNLSPLTLLFLLRRLIPKGRIAISRLLLQKYTEVHEYKKMILSNKSLFH